MYWGLFFFFFFVVDEKLRCINVIQKGGIKNLALPIIETSISNFPVGGSGVTLDRLVWKFLPFSKAYLVHQHLTHNLAMSCRWVRLSSDWAPILQYNCKNE